MTETETKPRKSALVIIDVQNNVVANAYDRDDVVDRIATLIEKAKAEDVPVIWVQHEDEELVRGQRRLADRGGDPAHRGRDRGDEDVQRLLRRDLPA